MSEHRRTGRWLFALAALATLAAVGLVVYLRQLPEARLARLLRDAGHDEAMIQAALAAVPAPIPGAPELSHELRHLFRDNGEWFRERAPGATREEIEFWIEIGTSPSTWGQRKWPDLEMLRLKWYEARGFERRGDLAKAVSRVADGAGFLDHGYEKAATIPADRLAEQRRMAEQLLADPHLARARASEPERFAFAVRRVATPLRVSMGERYHRLAWLAYAATASGNHMEMAWGLRDLREAAAGWSAPPDVATLSSIDRAFEALRLAILAPASPFFMPPADQADVASKLAAFAEMICATSGSLDLAEDLALDAVAILEAPPISGYRVVELAESLRALSRVLRLRGENQLADEVHLRSNAVLFSVGAADPNFPRTLLGLEGPLPEPPPAGPGGPMSPFGPPAAFRETEARDYLNRVAPTPTEVAAMLERRQARLAALSAGEIEDPRLALRNMLDRLLILWAI